MAGGTLVATGWRRNPKDKEPTWHCSTERSGCWGQYICAPAASINHISEAHAAAILARTTASGLTISLEPDFRLNPIHTDAIVAYLDSRRAISFREVQAV